MATIKTSSIGNFTIELIQFNSKSFPMIFSDNRTGTMQPMDLTVYDEISMTFRYPIPAGRRGLGKIYKTINLGDELTISGADNNFLLVDIRTDFFQANMPERLTTDILMRNGDVIRHYVGAICRIKLMNTHPA